MGYGTCIGLVICGVGLGVASTLLFFLLSGYAACSGCICN